MKLQPGTTVVNNGQLVDGTGKAAVPRAALVIQDGLIQYAGPAADAPQTPPDARVIDAEGGAIMPGLIEARIHLTYFDVSELQDLDIRYPVEYVTLQSGVNARRSLTPQMNSKASSFGRTSRPRSPAVLSSVPANAPALRPAPGPAARSRTRSSARRGSRS